MNTPEPKAVMGQWTREVRGAFSLPLSMSLGLEARDDTEAVSAILDWLGQPRDPFALRSAEIALRAFIDFECALGISESHQGVIDGQLLNAVDSAFVPAKSRAAINDALGERPHQRQRALDAAAMWEKTRPTDQSIYDWWIERSQDALR